MANEKKVVATVVAPPFPSTAWACDGSFYPAGEHEITQAHFDILKKRGAVEKSASSVESEASIQANEGGQPIEKSKLTKIQAVGQGLVLNEGGTHWVKAGPSKEGIAEDWVLNKAGDAYVAPTDPDAAV